MSADGVEAKRPTIRRGRRKVDDAQQLVAVMIRLPQDVLDHIDRASLSQFRSRTGEITLRLIETMANESFDEHGVIVQLVGKKAK